VSNQTLNENIKKYRKERGMTQEDLAKLLNVSRKTVSKWECERGLPDITQLPRIAKLFGITLEELIYTPEELQALAPPLPPPQKNAAESQQTKNEVKRKRKAILISTLVPTAALTVICAIVLIAYIAVGNGGVFRFEAENAVLRGNTIRVEGDINASNQQCVAYVFRQSIMFRFDSSHADDNVVLCIRMSSCKDIYDEEGNYIGIADVENVAAIPFLVVNNSQVFVSGSLPGSSVPREYYNWAVLTVGISLKAGKNEIVVVGSFDFNIDYMEFRSKKSKLSVSAVG